MSDAGIEVVSCVLLTKVVVRLLPLKRMMVVLRKPVPFTVKVNEEPPADLVVGEMLVIVGGVRLTVRFTAVEVPPTGVGLNTVMAFVPTAATSAAVICAVNCALLTKVVVRLLPFSRTMEVPTKPVPFTVKTKAGAPAPLLAGEIVVIAGLGLFTARLEEVVVPPLGVGLKTVIGKVPPD